MGRQVPAIPPIAFELPYEDHRNRGQKAPATRKDASLRPPTRGLKLPTTGHQGDATRAPDDFDAIQHVGCLDLPRGYNPGLSQNASSAVVRPFQGLSASWGSASIFMHVYKYINVYIYIHNMYKKYIYIYIYIDIDIDIHTDIHMCIYIVYIYMIFIHIQHDTAARRRGFMMDEAHGTKLKGCNPEPLPGRPLKRNGNHEKHKYACINIYTIRVYMYIYVHLRICIYIYRERYTHICTD